MADDLQTKTEKLIKYGKTQLSNKGVESSATTIRQVLDDVANITTGGSESQEGTGRLEPQAWKEMREAIHTDHNDIFFLVASGGIDSICVTGLISSTSVVEIYGGRSGTTLLKQYSGLSEFNLTTSDLENYPLPDGFGFKHMQGRPYSDNIIGVCELFGIIIKNPSKNTRLKELIRTECFYKILECSTSFVPTSGNFLYDSYYECPLLEFLFLYNLTSLTDSNFQNCISLHTVISEYPITEVQSNCFYNTALVNLDFLDPDCLLYGSCFYGCRHLKKARGLVNENSSSCFSNCPSLEEVILSENSTTIPRNFLYNSNIANINLPSNLVQIMDSAFYNVTKLLKINIPESVVSVPIACFSGCSSLDEINFLGETSFRGSPSLYSLKNIKIKHNGYLTSFANNNATSLRFIDAVNTSFGSFEAYGSTAYAVKLGLYGNIEGTASPTLGLGTPILIDFANSFKDTTKKFQCNYCCLSTDQLKAIFDYLPIVDSGTFKCGNQYKMSSTGTLNTLSSIYNEFLSWYNTLTTEQKKGWTVTA